MSVRTSILLRKNGKYTGDVKITLLILGHCRSMIDLQCPKTVYVPMLCCTLVTIRGVATGGGVYRYIYPQKSVTV